ncbi:MAG: hypothetical protein AMS22_13725 [Thiotrichales bacterium SG8_50]|nr:MAG: hypothetical protein AMS22_13725 [Thiotrichales bacterium SG8_50]
MIKNSRTVAIILAVLLAVGMVSVSGAETTDFRDFNKEQPFQLENRDALQRLVNALDAASGGTVACGNTASSLPSTNICDRGQFRRIIFVLRQVAPTLESHRLGIWKTDLNGDGKAEYVFTYRQRTYDPHVSFFQLNYAVTNPEVNYLFSVLGAEIWGVQAFGPNSTQKALLVRYQSCTECHPWVYVIPMTMDSDGKVTTYDFTYSDDHASWNWAIEYELPGRGHSVDAVVRSRIVNPVVKDDPHLIQLFDYQNGPRAWWVFHCQNLKCDYRIYEKSLPTRLVNLWNSGYEIARVVKK